MSVTLYSSKNKDSISKYRIGLSPIFSGGLIGSYALNISTSPLLSNVLKLIIS
jgi:hypothetical protein